MSRREISRCMKFDCTLRRQDFLQFGDAKQLQDSRSDIGKFQNAETLLDGGSLQANQSAEARAVEVIHIAEVDHDATTFR